VVCKKKKKKQENARSIAITIQKHNSNALQRNATSVSLGGREKVVIMINTAVPNKERHEEYVQECKMGQDARAM
jgi:predicted component of type VI protein secretion system